MKRALFIVDAELDFMPDGSLPVENGQEIVVYINGLLERDVYDYIFFSKDWHKKDHCSFKENGGEWPTHCVQGTEGAKIHPEILVPLEFASKTYQILKGMDSDKEQYSAVINSELYPKAEYDVVGLATDVCVKATALDLRKLGNSVVVLLDGCRGVSAKSTREAIDEMVEAGIVVA